MASNVSNPIALNAAAGGVSAPLIGIIAWVLSLWNIQLPADVAVYMTVLLSVGVHAIVVYINAEKSGNDGVAAVAAVLDPIGTPVPSNQGTPNVQ